MHLYMYYILYHFGLFIELTEKVNGVEDGYQHICYIAHTQTHTHICVYVCVCEYVCMFVYIYTYIYTHTGYGSMSIQMERWT